MQTLQTALGVALLVGNGCSNESRPSKSDSGFVDDTGRDGGDASTRSMTDAQADPCRERVECVSPRFGCRYVADDSCSACGSIVCDDAAVVTALDAGRDAASSTHDAETSGQDASLLCGTEGFGSFSRACDNQADCVVVEHQINCCGTRLATGLRRDVRAAFEVAEASCRASYPACGCAELAIRADDGTTASGSAQARVDCLAGSCATTFVSAGGSCASGGAACGPGYSCCYPCGIPGCSAVCAPSCSPGTVGCAGGCLQVP